jgi:hypothetical protein
MNEWVIAILGAVLVATILHWYPEHKACAAKGGVLTRAGECVQLVK